MNSFNWLDWSAFILVIIGGINWGLVGVFGFDLVAFIVGDMSVLARVIYSVVGLSAIYSIFSLMKRVH